jgi:hypothetical protein
MARIRTIKPEMFDDPDLGALSPLARWLFVGLLTQADKRGRLADEPERLKLRLLGFDRKADVVAILTELHHANLVIRYRVEGKAYLWVRTFEKHQHSHPKEPESKIPAYFDSTQKKHGEPEIAGTCRVDSGVLDSGVLDSGEGEGAHDAAPLAPAVPAPRPGQLQGLWNTGTTPPIPRCLDMSDSRLAKSRLRLREHPFDWWRDVIARIESSAFCRGQNDRGWVATFDWLIANDANALKVAEGKYDDRRPRAVTAEPASTFTVEEGWAAVERQRAERAAVRGRR